ncbi:hypothetical protein [Sulfuricurvum sp.]|uniref:hypothetical protein n=1 Tax=Sulfuricurvum sp. TaxID=2025608 RepID=UPI00261FFC66|nr:hypothetical protein [Sulfuricurvum sp.]MDD3597380.1 hypothetical protein [Sulfuricurvum sp.]
MNFLKWLVDIVFGWIMYIPKKIIQEMEKHIPLKEMNWNSVNEFFLVPKRRSGLLPIESVNLDRILIASLFFGLAVLINENFIATCNLCQFFIGIISSYFPGMIEMSHHSSMPQTVLFVLSFAYVNMPLFVLITLLRNRNIKYDQIDISSTRFIVGYFLACIFLLFTTYISVQAEVSFLFFPEHTSKRLLDFILATTVGLTMWIWLLTYLISEAIGAWIFMNIAIVKNFTKKDTKNEEE